MATESFPALLDEYEPPAYSPGAPSIVVMPTASDEVREQLELYEVFLRHDPAGCLESLKKFEADPTVRPMHPETPWRALTDPENELCKSYTFDEATEEAMERSSSLQHLIANPRRNQTVHLRARRLEVYLERLVVFRAAGQAAIAANSEHAA